RLGIEWTPVRRGAADVDGDTGDVGGAAPDRRPLDPETTGELGAQVGLVEVAAGLSVQEQPPAIQVSPAAVGPAGHVGDQDVGVQLRVAGAARAVAKRSGEKPVAEHRLLAAAPATANGGLALHVAKRGG